MKKLSVLKAMALLFVSILFFTGCEKLSPLEDESDLLNVETKCIKKPKHGHHGGCHNGGSNGETVCGETITVNLMNLMGESFGQVSISNDATNLYVSYKLVDTYYEIKKTNLYVGNNENLVNIPSLDNFPYKTNHEPTVLEYTYEIPLANLPECVTIAAQAEVIYYNEDGLELIESLWGDGDYIREGFEGMKFSYCKQQCEVQVPECGKSAWVWGCKYNKCNWPTYSTYCGKRISLPIYAEKYFNIGTATFTPATQGMVKITIQLRSGWRLKSGNNSIKIQGYDRAPSGNPNPEQFNTYTGNSTTITIPRHKYYGIHLDVVKIR